MSDIELQIRNAEERLCAAMLASDVSALDALLGPDLFFTNHLGMVFGKEEDLAAHENGIVKIHAIETSEQKIRISKGIAVVSVKMCIDGTFGGNRNQANLRFTRIWQEAASETWQLVAGHSSLIA